MLMSCWLKFTCRVFVSEVGPTSGVSIIWPCRYFLVFEGRRLGETVHVCLLYANLFRGLASQDWLVMFVLAKPGIRALGLFRSVKMFEDFFSFQSHFAIPETTHFSYACYSRLKYPLFHNTMVI